MPESAIVRDSPLRFITRAGPEIGVASTKAFTTQLAALFLLTLVLAKVRGRLAPEAETAYLEQLPPPVALHRCSNSNRPSKPGRKIRQQAPRPLPRSRPPLSDRPRRCLKLKEISPSTPKPTRPGNETRPPGSGGSGNAGHFRSPNDTLLEKLKSNLQEVRARGGELYVFADADSEIPETEGVHILRLPEHYGELSPSSTSCRSSYSPTMQLWSRERMWTNRATWPRASPSSEAVPASGALGFAASANPARPA